MIKKTTNAINAKNTLVSVIMPCFNDGKYISMAVDSLRAQTYPHIELIIIDDGSDDPETLQILSQLQFPSLQILHTNHVRPAAARNRGIEAAKGAYILPLDSDDTIEPEYIERAVEVLDKDSNVGIVYCHADLFGTTEGKWNLPDYELRLELLDNCIFVTALFRKADWQAVNGFSEQFKHGMEDYDFWLSLLELGREVVQLPETYFHYRIKPVSRTTTFNDNRKNIQQTYEMIYDRHRALYSKYMDIYCKELRRALIDATIDVRHFQNISTPITALSSDPVIEYWKSVRFFKPRTAKFIEKILFAKDYLKKLIGRK